MSFIVNGRAAPLRSCDKCGAQRPSTAFRVIAGRWICNWHSHYTPPEVADRVPLTTFKVRPFAGAKPFAPIPTYAEAEADLFAFLAENVGVDYVNSATAAAPVSTDTLAANRIAGAAWTGIYLHALITENKRPLSMIARAKTVLKAVADFLVTRMLGGPHNSTYTSASLQWGAFDQLARTTGSFTCNTRDAGAAGLALLRAYQVLGTATYLGCARAAAWYLRNVQRGDLLTAGWASSSDSGGTHPKYWGALAKTMDRTAGVLKSDHYYTPAELVVVEFWQAFRDAVGDETIGSTDTALSYSATRAALVSTCIAEARAFWTDGALDAVQAKIVNGFTSTTPFAAFNSYPSSKYNVTGTGAWEYSDGNQASGTMITALEWATGLRSLRALDGDSATVTGIFDWITTAADSQTYALPTTRTLRMSGYTDKTLWAGILGPYDGATAPSTDVGVVGTLQNASGIYDLAAVGLMGPLYSSRKQAKFRDLKAALSEPRPRSAATHDGSLRLPTLGRCGLSFQPYSDANLNRRRYVYLAAMTGFVYRSAPQAWGIQGHA